MIHVACLYVSCSMYVWFMVHVCIVQGGLMPLESHASPTLMPLECHLYATIKAGYCHVKALFNSSHSQFLKPICNTKIHKLSNMPVCQ